MVLGHLILHVAASNVCILWQEKQPTVFIKLDWFGQFKNCKKKEIARRIAHHLYDVDCSASCFDVLQFDCLFCVSHCGFKLLSPACTVAQLRKRNGQCPIMEPLKWLRVTQAHVHCFEAFHDCGQNFPGFKEWSFEFEISFIQHLPLCKQQFRGAGSCCSRLRASHGIGGFFAEFNLLLQSQQALHLANSILLSIICFIRTHS